MDIFDKEKTVISCFDLTGNMVRPWAEAGYLCYCVDIQHPQGEKRQGNIIRVGADMRDWLPPFRPITFAAFTAIKQSGLRIPEDVALIGFTDDAHAAYVTPRMSAIVDQSHLMGSTACRMLLQSIGGDPTVRREVVPQKLVIRETSARIPPAGGATEVLTHAD